MPRPDVQTQLAGIIGVYLLCIPQALQRCNGVYGSDGFDKCSAVVLEAAPKFDGLAPRVWVCLIPDDNVVTLVYQGHRGEKLL